MDPIYKKISSIGKKPARILIDNIHPLSDIKEIETKIKIYLANFGAPPKTSIERHGGIFHAIVFKNKLTKRQLESLEYSKIVSKEDASRAKKKKTFLSKLASLF